MEHNILVLRKNQLLKGDFNMRACYSGQIIFSISLSVSLFFLNYFYISFLRFIYMCKCVTVSYLKVVVIRLTIMLVVVGVVHLVQEVDGEPPGQARLRHIHMLRRKPRRYGKTLECVRIATKMEAFAYRKELFCCGPLLGVLGQGHFDKVVEGGGPVDTKAIGHNIILNRKVYTAQSREGTHHLFLSFSLGGWKLLFDIRNKALNKPGISQ